MNYLLGLIIPLFSFLLQSYPRLFNRYFGVDVWTRLIEIDHIRKANHKIPGKIKSGFIIEGYFDYPLFFPWIFSFFPKKLLLELSGFVSPFFDSLQNILVFFIAFQITQNLLISLVAQMIYALTPMIAVENSNLTPRSFGYLNFTLAFYPLFLFSANHQWIYLLIGFFFTCCLFLSHRFALQSFVFLSIFFSLVDWTPVYLLSLIFGFILVSLLTKGYYLRVLKGHLYNIYFWVENYKYRFAHQIYGNRSVKKLDWVGKIYHILSVFSPIMIFAINMWVLSAFIMPFIIFGLHINVVSSKLLLRMSWWVLFFYGFAILVLKLKQLTPIGEGQRYIEMATVPSSIMSAVIFFIAYKRFGFMAILIFVMLLVVNLGMIIFIQIKGIIKDRNRSVTSELTDVFAYINKAKGRPRVMCIPHQITTLMVYHTKADVLVNADNPGLMKITDVYPILKMSIADLAKKYSLDFLVLREGFAKLNDIKMKKAKIAFRSGDIVVVKL